MSKEILPCPFCGGHAELTGFKAPEFWVRCPATGCKASTEGFGSKERAIQAWNTRTYHLPNREEVAMMEAAFLVALAEHGFPTDFAEVLVHGNPLRHCPPGALRKALSAAILSLMERKA